MTTEVIDKILKRFSDDRYKKAIDVQTKGTIELDSDLNIEKIMKLILMSQVASIDDDFLSIMAESKSISEKDIVRFKGYQSYLKKKIVKDALFALDIVDKEENES